MANLHPAEHAEHLLNAEVMQLLADPGVKVGSVRWFEMHAKGCALSMLRGMIQAGAHQDPEAAVAYRKRIKVKNFEPSEATPA